MFTIDDVNNIENHSDEEEYFYSIQKAINSGMWGLQGSYGREMMRAIEEGRCMLGQESARDYYGNYIPSRDEVKPGTKGSYDFVFNAFGSYWAELMEDAE
jgi:hypothetical protein